ncbi:hypothetical protein EAS61_01665 [Bradyrhizobium zhanjiangense]|uniref:Uncharacterized protein n=1 Tax=Bradyrhizobium zhanjiangense TaxID=1325107 RepID=A0A4Q0R168_9BRAD|nr:hypothetical protein EAS61_01665 [Bradyrhizobium zhanjiangense]
MPFGGPWSAQVLSVVRLSKARRSCPPLAATILSIAFGCDRCASRLFAVGLLLVKDQISRRKE